ncbi:MAG: division/cell wall cluster transcriptional repressor MraZ [Peptococcaceae bacterium]|nr:division/cell wall cluster transcriptional repressor MraZ [Peptococcaceae bacterium]
MTFNGEYQHGIDDKGRLIMPARFRDALGLRYIICKGMESCLFVYTLEEWGRLEEKLNSLSVFNRRTRDFKRRFFSGSSECETDRQGRININQELRSYAHLEKEVYVIGAGDHLEIWDKAAWDSYRDGLDDDYEALAEELFQ